MTTICILCYKLASVTTCLLKAERSDRPPLQNDLPMLESARRKIYRHADYFTVSLAPEAALGYTDNKGDYFEACQVMPVCDKVICMGAHRDTEISRLFQPPGADQNA